VYWQEVQRIIAILKSIRSTNFTVFEIHLKNPTNCAARLWSLV